MRTFSSGYTKSCSIQEQSTLNGSGHTKKSTATISKIYQTGVDE